MVVAMSLRYLASIYCFKEIWDLCTNQYAPLSSYCMARSSHPGRRALLGTLHREVSRL